MDVVAKFHKVPYAIYKNAVEANNQYDLNPDDIQHDYDDIALPVRATTGSAGYDFYADADYVIPVGESVIITTGVSCTISDGWFLALFPRSGMGFKYGVRLANTVGVIDSDFVYGATCGHILVKLTNHDSENPIRICKGDRFCQGIFIPFGIVRDDDPIANQRVGGTGSTGA